MLRYLQIAFLLTLIVMGANSAFAQKNKNLLIQPAERRIALVIGNDTYQSVVRLQNARSDARAFSRSLEQVGFVVTLKLDLTEKAMREAVRNFKNQVRSGDVAVFYYSGHGVQLGGANYLLPTDIKGNGEDQVKDDALPLQRVMDDLQDQNAKFSLAIIDACRDNPFKGVSRRAIGGRGLVPTTVATGQMVMFSAGSGQQALDNLGPNDHNPNGLFTRILLTEMNKPGVTVDRVLRNVREQVVALAKSVNHDQVPALYDQSLGDFYFRPDSTKTQTANSARPEREIVQTQPAVASSPHPLQLDNQYRPQTSNSNNSYQNSWDLAERALWKEIEASSSREDFEHYLKTYPTGPHSDQARIRVQKVLDNAAAEQARGEQAVAVARERIEVQTWSTAEQENTVSGYRRYLSEYGRGSYATLAAIRIRKLEAAEDAKLAQQPGKSFKDCDLCPSMVVIPAGSYLMGTDLSRSESPQHSVTIPQPFAIGQTEVTQGEWVAIMGNNPSTNRSCSSNCPVEQVTWDDVQEFIKRLNARTGRQYRLPSEAEWEYACRANGRHEYCGSDDIDSIAWYGAFASSGGNSKKTTNPVKGKQPNSWGLYDMSGNVWEWVEDCWNVDYKGALNDGSAMKSEQCGVHVLRGGSYYGDAKSVRASNRTGEPTYRRGENYGFRLAKTFPKIVN